MDYLESLSQFEMAGIILQLVALPFLVIKLRLFWWAKQSLQWPKVNGVVVKSLDFPLSKIIDFLYSYEINGSIYHRKKPFIANSFKNFSQKKVTTLINNYKEGKQLTVYYKPSNPNISTLEPGRMDGVLSALALLLLLFALGFISFYYPTLLVELIDHISKF
jgi:hypothetical protein